MTGRLVRLATDLPGLQMGSLPQLRGFPPRRVDLHLGERGDRRRPPPGPDEQRDAAHDGEGEQDDKSHQENLGQAHRRLPVVQPS
jgi:hypothetical protein